MKSEWVTVPLGDVLTLQRGHDLPTQNRLSGEIPILGSSGITGFHNEAKATGPGVTVGRSGNSMGEISYSDKDFWPLNTALYVTDFKGNDPKFLYYLLQTIDFDQFNSGSAQKSLNRNAVYPFEVEIPKSRAEQERISSVLSSLEEKVGVNQKINQTLEQMAQAIFKSWFVDFEPVKAKIAALEAGGSEEDALLAAMQAISAKDEIELARLQAEQPEQYAELRATAELFPSAMQESELGEIPEGWSVGHLSELIQFNPRRSLKKGTLAHYLDMKNVPTSGHLAEDIVLREMNSGTKFINGDSLLARITPCLENGKTAYVDFLDSDQVGWGSTEYIVMRSQEPYPESLSYFIARNRNFRQHAIQSMTGTSGRQRANAKALAELPWIIYPQEIAVAFGRIATPYLRLARSHGNESKSLSAIRDSLLPKLLSGELEITRKDA